MRARLRPPPVRRSAAALCLWLAMFLAPAAVHAQAQWMMNGLPVCVIPGCSGRLPKICSDGAAGAVIAWDRNPTLSDENIYVHRVLAGGMLDPVWPPKGTPATRAPGDQHVTDIAPDGASGAFVVWYDFPNYDIYAQHVLANGTIAPGWPADGLPVSVASARQLEPRLLADGAGGVFIVWQDGSGSLAADIRALHLTADGTRVPGWPADGIGVCTAQGLQLAPMVGSDGQGGFFVAWTDTRNGVGAEIYAQRVTWSGEVAASWPVDGRQIAAAEGIDEARRIWGVVPDRTGGAYIGWWVGYGPEIFEDDVYAIRILADGSTAPGWPANGYAVCALPDVQQLTSVVADSTGGVFLAWYDHRTYPAVAYAQRLQRDGTPALGWQPNGNPVSNLPGYHYRPEAAPDGRGGVYVAFQEAFYGSGHMQHLNASGSLAPGWPSPGIPLVNDPTGAMSQRDLRAVADGVGGAIVTWEDFRDGREQQLYAQRYLGDGPTPVLVALVSAEALPDRVTLTWHRADGALHDARVERRREVEDWRVVGRASFDGTGRLRFEDGDVSAGARYAYRLGWSEAGVDRFSAETWVDVPVALTLALEGARPNPVVGPLTVAFTLPRAEAATLELLDVAGRQVVARDVGGFGPGSHMIRLGECNCTPPGVYWLRLTQSGRSLVQRAAIVR